MALTNAEKQRRWRDQRRAVTKQAQEHKGDLATLTSLANDGADSQKVQQACEAIA